MFEYPSSVDKKRIPKVTNLKSITLSSWLLLGCGGLRTSLGHPLRKAYEIKLCRFLILYLITIGLTTGSEFGCVSLSLDFCQNL